MSSNVLETSVFVSTYIVSGTWPKIACVMRDWGGEEGVTKVVIFCVGVRATLFWSAIYCTKPRANTGSHFGSLYLRGMGRWFMRIMQEYNLATAIEIITFTQLCTCESGSYSFSAMSWHKSVSMNRASSPSMPSTEREKRENCFHCLRQCLVCLSLFYFLHLSMIFLLVSYCRCLRLSLQVWGQLWCQSGFTISPGWGLHLWYLIRAPPDGPPPLICCGPGVWGVFHVRCWRGRLIERGRGDHPALHCDVQCRVLHGCS